MHRTRKIAISKIPQKEDVINKIWRNSLILLLLLKKSPKLLDTSTSTLAYLPKNTWTSLLLKIYIYELIPDDTLHSSLLQILLLECNFRKPFYVSESFELINEKCAVVDDVVVDDVIFTKIKDEKCKNPSIYEILKNWFTK
jgi:hypothetical protein